MLNIARWLARSTWSFVSAACVEKPLRSASSCASRDVHSLYLHPATITAATFSVVTGCLELWQVEARVDSAPDGIVVVHTAGGKVTVRAIDVGWEITAPAVAGEPPATWAHASVGPMLRSLRVLLAPDQPHARLIVARAPGAEA